MKYYLLKNSLVINVDGKTHTISKEDYRYERAKLAIENNDYESAKLAIDPSSNLNKDGFCVENGLVCYKGESIPTILGNQFLNLKEDNWIFRSLFNFWYNMKTRVDRDTASEMLDALVEKNAYPVTEDGFYLVYFDRNLDQTTSVLNKRNLEEGINFYNVANCPDKYLQLFAQRKSFDDILTCSFGFTAKKLKKIALSSIFKVQNNFFDYNFLLIGEALNQVLQPDNIYGLIEENIFQTQNNNGIDAYQKINILLKDISIEKGGKYNQKKVINFLRSANNMHILIDTAEYYTRVKEAVGVDIQELGLSNSCDEYHEHFRREFRRLKDPEVPLMMEKNFENIYSLSDVEVAGLRFLVPNNNYDLREWSNIMHNCIATYADRVKTGQTAVFAIMDSATNDMLYNIEISRGRIVQFLTKHNREAKPKDYNLICDFLKEKGIIFKE